jgi:hypothetical protein
MVRVTLSSRTPFLASALALGALAGPGAGAAPRTLGHGDCEKCHKPAVQKWARDEVAQLGAEAHANTHKQLAGANAARWAAAIGLASPAEPGGRCAQCHATVVRGRVRSGVSCESCHGPAGDYLDVHDDEPWPASYRKAISLGLRDLHEKTAAVAKLCVDCHVTPEKALAAAGHPDGAGFDAGASLQKIVHWTAAFTPNGAEHARYDFAQVTAAAKPLVARALSGGGGASRAAASAPAAAAPDRAAPSGAVLAAPWDWDKPVQRLPADFPSTADQAPAPRPPPPPSIVDDRPLAVDALPAVAPVPRRPPEAEGPRPAAAQLAELRGRALGLLAGLLAEGRRAPGLDAPAQPAEFEGPDGELLHLQDVVFYLALETLGREE